MNTNLDLLNADGLDESINPMSSIKLGAIKNLGEKVKKLAENPEIKAKIESAKKVLTETAKADEKKDTIKLPAPKEEDKFLGMPKKTGIAVAVIGIAVIVGGYFIIKKMRNK